MARFAVLVSLVTLLVALPALAQSSPQPPFQRDSQAIAILAQAFKALGGTVPPDSLASGTFARISGSTSDTGSIQIMTRGYSQTAEKITAGGTTTSVVYSQGYSGQKNGSGTSRFSLERSLSSDSAMFPLITIAAAQDPTSGAQFVGNETVNGTAAYHLRIWRNLADQNFSGLSAFAIKDIWINSASSLPLEVTFDMRDADGSAPHIPVALFFSDYRSTSGIMYPFQISKSLNGTPYLAIAISNVAFNTGLTDLDFSLN
jgi:hypothetical protein